MADQRRPGAARRAENDQPATVQRSAYDYAEHDEHDPLPPWLDPDSSDYDPTDPTGYWWLIRRRDEEARELYGFGW